MRHINQLRPNHMQTQYRQEAEEFQWDILLDTFGLDDENVRPLESSQNMTASHSLQIGPNRKRKRPSWLQVNPKRKNDDQIQAVRKQLQIGKGVNTAAHQPSVQRNNRVVKQCRTSTPTRRNHVRFHHVQASSKVKIVHMHFTPT
ncbi:hypothetical protein CRM22_003658 [Opisthorchis felineus]|uniref:Uncharacterized protein n=1 Tax=Opisthorchis felineus TaxID=147828 RepID=A0A4V3SFT1_OPIFE|nr:hypothetical protein CRM22_003658 [Opisthorchis felineus]